MTLLLDNRQAMQGVPGLHALVVGVSDYSNLRGAADPVPPHHFGLRKVDGPAYAAWAVAQALQSPPANAVLRQPLKTLRLLLAPSAADRALDAGLAAAQTDVPTLQNVSLAAMEWQYDCSESDDEVSFMYFAGHGLSDKGEDCLVCADFATTSNPNNPSLRGCGTFSSLMDGMAGPVPGYAIARQQAWFIDACRIGIDGSSQVPVAGPEEFLGVRLPDGKPRDWPGLWATSGGAYASVLPGGITAFTEALLQALNGAVGQMVRWPDPARPGMWWPVTMNSIRGAVAALMARDPRTARQVPAPVGSGGDKPLLMFPEQNPPKLKGRITAVPPGAAAGVTKWSARRIEGAPPNPFDSVNDGPFPFDTTELYAGTYEVRWTVGGNESSRGWVATLGNDEFAV